MATTKKKTVAELEAEYQEAQRKWKARLDAARAAEKKAAEQALLADAKRIKAERDALLEFVRKSRVNQSNSQAYDYWNRFASEYPDEAKSLAADASR